MIDDLAFLANEYPVKIVVGSGIWDSLDSYFAEKLSNNIGNSPQQILIKGLEAKFFQNRDLRNRLTAVADSTLLGMAFNPMNELYEDINVGELLLIVKNKILSYDIDPDANFPPWIAFPNISPLDMFWGMGLGEEYIHSLFKYLQNEHNSIKHKAMFPEITGWEDFYE
jgi:hypothetical protein